MTKYHTSPWHERTAAAELDDPFLKSPTGIFISIRTPGDSLDTDATQLLIEIRQAPWISDHCSPCLRPRSQRPSSSEFFLRRMKPACKTADIQSRRASVISAKLPTSIMLTRVPGISPIFPLNRHGRHE